MKILFSPVGNNDPISRGHDGSMLHIVRKYSPDQVILLLSERMLEKDAEDNRYSKAIESVNPNIRVVKIPVTGIEVHNYNDMFDYFHNQFQKYFDNPEYDEKIVNIASGTPQMKMALTLFATFRDDIKCVQVTTPKNDSNAGTPHGIDDDAQNIETQISQNLDNVPDFKNRCYEVEVPAVNHKVQVENIKTLIQSYAYSAAVELVKSNGLEINQAAKNLLIGASFRSILNGTAKSSFQETEFAYDPKSDALSEYMNILQLKLYRGEYADFVRAFTPAIEEVLFAVLEKYGIKKEDFTKQINVSKASNKSSSVLDINKINKPSTSEHIKLVFKDAVPSKKNGAYFYYNSHLYALLKLVAKEEIYKEFVEPIETLEKSFRNLAAHEIIMIDKQRITQTIGIEPETVLEKMAKLTGTELGLYDRINAKILEML